MLVDIVISLSTVLYYCMFLLALFLVFLIKLVSSDNSLLDDFSLFLPSCLSSDSGVCPLVTKLAELYCWLSTCDNSSNSKFDN